MRNKKQTQTNKHDHQYDDEKNDEKLTNSSQCLT